MVAEINFMQIKRAGAHLPAHKNKVLRQIRVVMSTLVVKYKLYVGLAPKIIITSFNHNSKFSIKLFNYLKYGSFRFI